VYGAFAAVASLSRYLDVAVSYGFRVEIESSGVKFFGKPATFQPFKWTNTVVEMVPTDNFRVVREAIGTELRIDQLLGAALGYQSAGEAENLIDRLHSFLVNCDEADRNIVRDIATSVLPSHLAAGRSTLKGDSTDLPSFRNLGKQMARPLLGLKENPPNVSNKDGDRWGVALLLNETTNDKAVDLSVTIAKAQPGELMRGVEVTVKPEDLSAVPSGYVLEAKKIRVLRYEMKGGQIIDHAVEYLRVEKTKNIVAVLKGTRASVRPKRSLEKEGNHESVSTGSTNPMYAFGL
jgi:hypothetical protein